MAPRQSKGRFEGALLRPSGDHHRIPDIRHLGRTAGDAGLHQATATAALTPPPNDTQTAKQEKPTKIHRKPKMRIAGETLNRIARRHAWPRDQRSVGRVV